VVEASERKMMAKEVLVNRAVSISLVCRIFLLVKPAIDITLNSILITKK
jgi:hypothetical protein